MDNISILKIRLQGIIGCIDQYTSEPSISVIKDSLTTALLENDFDIILFTCQEIDKWYTQNISEICSNQFVHNKDVHRNNVQLIKSTSKDLEKNHEEYSKAFSALKKAPKNKAFDLDSLVYLFDRFHQVTTQLRNRHENRETLDVSDEYDVQDLLHSLLKIYCDDIRPEEWTPSYAGTSSRQDFLLKKEEIVIETKMTRKGLGNKELANELIIDTARYREHPNCKKLVCFVYDPENRIQNPRGFENDLSKPVNGIDIIVIIRS